MADQLSPPQALLALGVFPVLVIALVGPVVAPEAMQSNWPSNLPQWLAIANLAVCAVLAALLYVREGLRRYRTWVNQ